MIEVFYPVHIPSDNFLSPDIDVDPGVYDDDTHNLVDIKAAVEIDDEGRPQWPKTCEKCDKPATFAIHVATQTPDEYRYYPTCLRHTQEIIKWARTRDFEMTSTRLISSPKVASSA